MPLIRGTTRYREIERQLDPLLKALVAGRPFRRGTMPAVPAVAGVYLFSEERNHRYVGRTRNANRRLCEHTRPSSPENSAPFAFNIARRDAAAAGLEVDGPRKAISARADFEPYFIAAKERVRAMDFRVVEIDDAAVSTIFEVYASIVLGTEGDYNLFETH